MVDLRVSEALAGVQEHLQETTTGFKLTSENQFKRVVLLPRERQMGVMNG